jgi:methylase of polypeptide subunit release factors
MRLNDAVPADPAPRSDPALVARLRDDLFSAGFTVDALESIWGEDAAAALRRGHREPARRSLAAAAGSPTATLAMFFVLGLPVAEDELASALPALGVAGCEALGLAAREGSLLRPRLDLRPVAFVDDQGPGSWFIASDLGEATLGHAIPEGHVLGVGGASLTLAGLLDPARVGTVLDLGTGCGILALQAARHARRVVATDISERALAIAALNARLNNVTSIEFRLGSLYEPVVGERFDRIVSNPPFVITPRVEGVPAYEYRDGGLVGDAIVEAVITGAADRLVPGGTAHLLGNWEYRDGVDAFDRLTGWLDGTGLDAWIVEREVQDPALYAETWIRDGGTLPRTGEFDRLYGAWLDDFRERGVTAVGFGYVVLRRPLDGAPTLRRLERLGGAIGANPGTLGGHVVSTLAAHDTQAGLDDAGLAACALTVASDVTEERHYWPGDEDPTVMDLRQGGGFGRTYPLGTALAAVVGACDGDLPLGAICSAVAQLLEVDGDELRAEVLPAVRELLVTGFLRF